MLILKTLKLLFIFYSKYEKPFDTKGWWMNE